MESLKKTKVGSVVLLPIAFVLGVLGLGSPVFFSTVSEITLKDSSYLTLSFRGNDRKMITGDEVVFWTKQARDYRKIRDSEVVFVGYGIVAPEKYRNDYEGIDV